MSREGWLSLTSNRHGHVTVLSLIESALCAHMTLGYLMMLVSIVSISTSWADESYLSQEAFSQLIVANDQHRSGRMLTVERTGIDNVIIPDFWKYPDLKEMIDPSQPFPETISYIFLERFIVRDGIVAFEKELQRPLANNEDSVVTLSPYSWWSNRGGLVRHSYGLGASSTFSVHRNTSTGVSAEGLLKLAETEFCLGVGIGKRLRHVSSFEVNKGIYHVAGTVEFMPGVVYDTEFTADRNLIVRSLKATVPTPTGRQRILEVETEGMVSPSDSTPMASAGTLRWFQLDSKKQADADGHDKDRRPGEKDAHKRAFSVRFVSLSPLLTNEEFDRFTMVRPQQGAHIENPEGIEGFGNSGPPLPRPAKDFYLFWTSTAFALVILLAYLSLRKRERQRHK